MAKLIALVTLLASGAAAFSAPATSRPALRATSPQMAEKLPPGWKKVKSMSRQGQFSYLNTKTGQRFDKLPRGQTFYDDEADTTAKPCLLYTSPSPRDS